MTTRSILRSLPAALALLALMAAAVGCGDDTPATTLPVEFGEGEIPSSVPDDFLVDHINNRTEFKLRMRFDLASAEQYFNVELVNRGYLVPVSRDTGMGLWEMQFSKGDLQGGIVIRNLGDVVQAVVEVNRS